MSKDEACETQTGNLAPKTGAKRLAVSIATLGCKVNRYESRALEEALEGRGHRVVAFGEPADAVVVNSCTVTHRSDRDVRALVRRARRTNPRARIVVTGCLAQVDPDSLRALGVDLVVGTAEKGRLPELLEGGAGGIRVGELIGSRRLDAEPVTRFGGRTRAFLKVQDGCEAFCAYCIVPHARGASRSLPADEVERGLERVRTAGHREVVLTGVHLGRWGRDLEPAVGFEALLDLAENSGLSRVRLSSLEPMEVTDSVADRLARSESLCPHLHVPLQSGSDGILEAMGRPYTTELFRQRMEVVRERVPHLCLGFDVIVGFPGEDEEGFAETEAFLADLDFAYLHVFPFSPRRGTPAWEMGGKVSPDVIKARARRLRELSLTKRDGFHRSQIGRIVPALAEGEVRNRPGVVSFRTRNYVPVAVPWSGPVPVDEIELELTAADGAGAIGRPARRVAEGA